MGLKCRRNVTMILFALPGLGCIAVRSDEEVALAWPPEAESTLQPLTLRFSMKVSINGAEQDGFTHLEEEAKKIAFDTYASAGVFGDVIPHSEPGRMIADIVLENHESANNALLVLFVFVSTLIPAYVEDNLTLTTTLKDGNDRTVATIRKSAQLTTWMQLFLLFGMPFAYPTSVMRDLQTQLHRETIHEMISRGVFAEYR